MWSRWQERQRALDRALEVGPERPQQAGEPLLVGAGEPAEQLALGDDEFGEVVGVQWDIHPDTGPEAEDSLEIAPAGS